MGGAIIIRAIAGEVRRIGRSGITLNGVIIVSAYISCVLIALALWALIVIAGLRLIHWAWPS
jgi:hypothetical protein